MNLSDAQRRVLKWIGYGWTAEPGAGTAIMVNGQRICNVDTMTALYRAGFATKDNDGRWKATEAGKNITGKLAL